MIPKLTTSLAIVVLFGSCYAPHYMYNPTAHNVPVLIKKGDSKVAAYYSSNLSGDLFTENPANATINSSQGLDVQGAVAVTDHVAIQANYFYRSEKNSGYEDNPGNTLIKYKRHLAEIGVGYFISMHRHDKVLFQVFGGAGMGNFSFIDHSKDPNNNTFFTRNHETDVTKLYLQPAFIFNIKENFALSVSSRFSVINFHNIKTDYTQQELEYYYLNDLPYGSRTFWEPAFTNSFGFKNLKGVKFEYQFSSSLLASDRTIDYRSFNFALGILLDPHKIFQSRSED